ncbi:MAG: glycerophosphodiester phosphodiesterase family protein [Psychrilyobacter sp.]|uniref:glycerophosphodiester phosphodiesterase n=1 Tax=Psychrilyobacter sp. TaxID=2586924 RepID=UPI003C733A32
MKIVAHRGASGYAPENTKASILEGLKQKCDGFEVDVQLTKDNEVVIFHDWSLERTTNGNGFLKDQTLTELKNLDIGSWFSKEFKGEKIMTLKELLEIVPIEKLLNIEIKVRHGEINQIEKKVIEILEKSSRLNNNIIISSFDHRVIKKINEINPEIQVGLLITAGLLDLKNYVSNFNLYSIHCGAEFINKINVDDLKEIDIKTYAWTVNTLEESKILASFGVEGIITNYPDIF